MHVRVVCVCVCVLTHIGFGIGIVAGRPTVLLEGSGLRDKLPSDPAPPEEEGRAPACLPAGRVAASSKSLDSARLTGS